MKQQKNGQNFTLVFKKGEPFIATLREFCQNHNVSAGFFHALGGVLDADIGYYHLDKQEYEFRRLDQVLEIVSLHGNIALKDGEPFVHAHAVLSDSELRTYGGHVKELTVGGTCELQLETFNSAWRRIPDTDTGLSLIELDESS